MKSFFSLKSFKALEYQWNRYSKNQLQTQTVLLVFSQKSRMESTLSSLSMILREEVLIFHLQLK
jgi:hypothetical protein